MDQLQRLRSHPVLVIAACGAVVASVAVADARAATVIDITSSAVPTTSVVDLTGPGATAGDLFVFRSELTNGSGASVGQLLGFQTTIALGPSAQSAQGALTFDMADGQIVVGGTSSLATDTSGLLPGAPTTRAVLGGTGAYDGMRGQVTATRRADGSYAQHFVLMPASTATAGSVDVYGSGNTGIAVDLAAPGPTPGDTTMIDSALVDAAGRPAGRVLGSQTLVSAAPDRMRSEAQLTFQLSAGTIVVGGLSERPPSGAGLVPGVLYARPVLGGTGRYAGVTGTVSTTLEESGRYRSHFALRPGTGAAKAQTVQAIAANSRPAQLDLGPAGLSSGDVNVFNGPITSPLGKRIGIVRGTQTMVAVDGGALTMSSTVTYELRGRGQIVVGGVAPSATAASAGPLKLRRFDRAVLGGTGDFAGAHGSLRTVRRADGTYRLTFSLLGAPSRKR
jgi:hypothetical protein